MGPAAWMGIDRLVECVSLPEPRSQSRTVLSSNPAMRVFPSGVKRARVWRRRNPLNWRRRVTGRDARSHSLRVPSSRPMVARSLPFGENVTALAPWCAGTVVSKVFPAEPHS